MQTTITYKIRKYTVKFLLSNDMRQLKVLKIDKDGSCLYSSIVQQLSCCKPNTDDHREATKDLRKDVIDYMKTNLQVGKFAIKGRILEDRESDGDRNVKVTEADCMDFITNKLSRMDYWGGTESILAITILRKVNILMFNEADRFYFPAGFDSNFDQTVIVAFRLAIKSDKKRNHYDSVAEIEQGDLFDCAKYVASIL